MLPADLFDTRGPRPDEFEERCQGSFDHFKEFMCDVARSAAGHVLAVVKSLYPRVNLEMISEGFAQGVSDVKIPALQEEVSEPAVKLADDLDLFGDKGDAEK